MAGKHPEVYHCLNCPCGSPIRFMSPQEYLVNCFHPRQQQKNNLTLRMVAGSDSLISQPMRKNVIDNEYKGTRIDDNSPRPPILCSHGHQTWSPGSERTTSSMDIQTPYTLSTLMRKLGDGEYIDNAWFKHFKGEYTNANKFVCFCTHGLELSEDAITERRKAALSGNKSIQMVLVKHFTGKKFPKWDLRYYVHKPIGQLNSGAIVNRNEFIDAGQSIPLLESGKTTFWLWNQGVGSLPTHCAGYLCQEDDKAQSQINLPDGGSLLVVIPRSKLNEYTDIIKSLQNSKVDEENESEISFSSNGKVEMSAETKFNFSGDDYYVAKITWGAAVRSFVRDFLKKCTGLESQKVRWTKPLRLELYDNEHNQETPINKENPHKFYCVQGHKYKIRIRRSGNQSNNSFMLRVGPSIKLNFETLNPDHIAINKMGIDDDSSGKVYNFFVKRLKLQKAIWFDLEAKSAPDAGSWLEVFESHQSVEASGMRVEFAEE